jgi:transposase
LGLHADAAIGGDQMEVLYGRCAGLDVHKDTVVACARIAEGGAETKREVRTFATTTRGLLELSDWMAQHGCTHVAMEATGVYWKPVWHVLEDSFELVLANVLPRTFIAGRKCRLDDGHQRRHAASFRRTLAIIGRA